MNNSTTEQQQQLMFKMNFAHWIPSIHFHGMWQLAGSPQDHLFTPSPSDPLLELHGSLSGGGD